MSIAKREIELASAPANQQITDPSRSGKGLRFREVRLKIPEAVNCVLKWRDFYGKEMNAKVLDLSRYGCRVTMANEAHGQKMFTRIVRAQIEIDSAVAYSGGMMFVNERQEPDGSISAGVTLEQAGCDLDALSAATGIETLSIENDLSKVLTISKNVSEKFKIYVADLNALLQEVKQKLEIEERKVAEVARSENHRTRLEERVISVAISVYGPEIQKVLSYFQEFVKDMHIDEEIPYKEYFRLNFQLILRGTPFVERGLKKPLGYSGDYGMMVMLYEYEDKGGSLFHRFFHRFVCSEPAAVANRNRIGFLSDILLNHYDKAIKAGAKNFTIASLACGPAREIYEFVKYAPLTTDVPIKIVLIDAEEHALDYAQARLRELAIPERTVEFVFLKEDVVTGTLQGKEFLSWVSNSDFVISAGLFDYLTDRVSKRMITALHSCLKPGGELLIGNISKRSPDVFAMDYFMDWRLILRDESDLLNLISEELANSGADVDVVSESLGLNLFLRVRRKRGG